ncbi:MAG TPA: glycosyltransferase family 2 protein [Candidatus Acidoferrum sp.]
MENSLASQTVCAAPTKHNTCAIIVTYHPDTHFIERLDKIRDQVAKTIIVDNTGGPELGALRRDIDNPEIEIISNAENLGIGEALNQGMARAIELGYAWAITFDQDSWAHSDLVTTLISIYEKQPRPELVGIIGCNFEDENIDTPGTNRPTPEPIFRETETVITSGSLLSAGTFSTLGPFRSDFFIDFVDHEYCLRLRRSGYKVLISTTPLMVHALGTPTLFTLAGGVGGLSLVLTNRSPLRRYYVTRNALLVAREYFSVAPKWVLRSLASTVGFALLKIPLEKDARSKKLRATLYGAFDALRSNAGKARGAWLEE